MTLRAAADAESFASVPTGLPPLAPVTGVSGAARAALDERIVQMRSNLTRAGISETVLTSDFLRLLNDHLTYESAEERYEAIRTKPNHDLMDFDRLVSLLLVRVLEFPEVRSCFVTLARGQMTNSGDLSDEQVLGLATMPEFVQDFGYDQEARSVSRLSENHAAVLMRLRYTVVRMFARGEIATEQGARIQ